MKSTPGPWQWINDRLYSAPGIEGDAVLWAEYDSEFEPTVACLSANASLIAAAPDLLGACKAAVTELNLIDRMQPELVDYGIHNLLVGVIAKAEGRKL